MIKTKNNNVIFTHTIVAFFIFSSLLKASLNIDLVTSSLVLLGVISTLILNYILRAEGHIKLSYSFLATGLWMSSTPILDFFGNPDMKFYSFTNFQVFMAALIFYVVYKIQSSKKKGQF